MGCAILRYAGGRLLGSFGSTSSFSRSMLFGGVCRDRCKAFKKAPCSTFINSFCFSGAPRSVSLLRRVSRITTDTRTPFLDTVTPKVLSVGSFDRLPCPHSLTGLFRAASCTH